MTTLVDQPITFDDGWFVGEDKTFTFTVYVPGTTQAQVDADPTANRQNLTGWTIEWKLRKARSNPTVILSKTGVALTQSGTTIGQFTVSIARADTTALKAGTYKHAAARTNSGAYDIVAEGDAVLRKAVAGWP